MRKKVLIIEDVVADYYRIAEALDNYDISYYPSADDCDDFSDLLAYWANTQNPVYLDKIRQILKQFSPEYILLDIGLRSSNSDDKTGLILNDELIKKEFPNILVYQITGRFIHDEITESIAKNGDVTLDQELFEKFISETNIGPTNNDAKDKKIKEPTSNDQEEKKKQIEKIKLKYTRPQWLETTKTFTQNKITPTIQFIIDTGITYIFYLLMAFLGVQGPLLIFIAFRDNPHEVLVVAETAFVAFLPLLVVFGFFVFYIMSLRPYITGAKVTDPINYEKTSELLIFTKKLFISSLISFLFTKLIDHLFLDKPRENKIDDYFNRYHHTFTPLVQLYASSVAIILLIAYYVYLGHHQNSKTAQ